MNPLFPSALALALLLPATLLAQEWRNVTPLDGPAPAPRSKGAAIYDPVAHRMVVFGGTNSSGVLNDIWALDLRANRWTDLTPDTDAPTPAPRLTPTTIYDAERHRMLMWSGEGTRFFNDIWAFDLAVNTWTELTPADPKPSPRYGAVSALDPQSMHMAVFAGFTDAGRFGDTWRYDLESNAWTQIFVDEGPGRRCLHSASYDQAGRRMIIYGGQRSGALGDIWAFDFQANTWTDWTPADSPPGRYFTAHVYDAAQNRAVVFGGNLGGSRSNEVWAFDDQAKTWQLLVPQGIPPSARDGAMAIMSPAEGRMVVFGGGGSGSTYFSEVWSLDELSPPASTAIEERPAQPQTFALHQNHPNPANPSTAIRYELAGSAHVRLGIYDLLGQEIRVLVDGVQPAGVGAVSWDGTDAAGQGVGTGVYLYRLQTPGGVQAKKLVLVR
jgi:hypothetical protein